MADMECQVRYTDLAFLVDKHQHPDPEDAPIPCGGIGAFPYLWKSVFHPWLLLVRFCQSFRVNHECLVRRACAALYFLRRKP